MSEPRYRDWILETIDSLRSRKARPDLERICRMVRRRHGSEPDRTCSELEKLIQEQTVLKVNYKGSISYRNAAKVQRSRRKMDQTTKPVVKQTTLADFSNGDSAFGPTDEDEMGDIEVTQDDQFRDPMSDTSAVSTENGEVTLAQTNKDGCLNCGAVVCMSGSCTAGIDGVKASAPTYKLPQTGSGTTLHDRGKNANNGSFPSIIKGSNGLSTRKNCTIHKKHKTCANVSNTSKNHQHKPKASSKPKLGFATKWGQSESHPNTSNVGDRLAHSAWNEAGMIQKDDEFKGHAKQSMNMLGSSSFQECLSQDEMTHGKVKVESEREDEKPTAMETDSNMDEEETEATRSGRGSAFPSQRGGHVPDRCGQPISVSEGTLTQSATLSDTSVHSFTSNTTSLPIDLPTATEPSSCPNTLKQEGGDGASGHTEYMPPGIQGDTGVLELRKQPPAICPSVRKSSLKGEEGTRAEESAVTPDQLASDCGATLGEASQASDGGNHSCSYSSEECKERIKGIDIATTCPREQDALKTGGMNKGLFVKREETGPDPLQWSVEDVACYFTAAGFPEQAVAFRSQEIDGKSLLLMQRSDVLTGLSIRLGPALKIYEHHVKALQRSHFQNECDLC